MRSATLGSLLILTACATGTDADLDLSDVGFATPESVLHDPVADVYLVSNISGDPFAHDGDGFVSRVAPDGRVLELRWIAGGVGGVELDAPKGMALTADHLWIADIDQVRRFDRRTGAPAGSVRIDGASFLNDVTVGPDGAVYVTDSGFAPGFAPNGTDAVWRIDADLHAAPLCRTTALDGPNGIAAGPRDLFVVTWQRGLFALVDASGPTAPVELPAKQLDGLVRTPAGRWFASSWEGRCVYEIAPNGTTSVVCGDLDAPADIGFDAQRGRLLIPLFMANRLVTRKP